METKITKINENKIILEEELAKRLGEQKFKNTDIENLEEENNMESSRELKDLEGELKALKRRRI